MSAGDKGCVVITGASGLLGRALMTRFKESSAWDRVMGTVFSRTSNLGETVKLDLTDAEKTVAFIEDVRPRFLVHSAAQRFPDKVDKDFEAAKKLNVESTEVIAKAMRKVKGHVLYISTDYVFDGKNPPYAHDDQTCPVNDYGILKRDGEVKTIQADQDNLVLRIPILYGDVEYLGESAVTVLFEKLLQMQGQDDARVEMSDYEIRRPSHVKDIAAICHDLLLKKLKSPESVSGIYQWCGREALTKYGMAKAMGEAFQLDDTGLVGNAQPPPPTGVQRPHNTTLNTDRLDVLGIGAHTKFSEGISDVLRPWFQK